MVQLLIVSSSVEIANGADGAELVRRGGQK
jgi:hypothetical protein